MNTRIWYASLASALILGCGRGGPAPVPDTQSFSRAVDATPSAVVKATQEELSARNIAIAAASQADGEVTTVPLDPNGEWGNVPPAERVNCAGVTDLDPNARIVMTMRVRSKGGRSNLSLKLTRDGGPSCVLQQTFVNDLLDAIVARARPIQ